MTFTFLRIAVADPKPPLNKENSRKAASDYYFFGRYHELYRGKHLLIDCRNVSREVCLDDKAVLKAMAKSAERAGATVVSQVRYHFEHNSPPGFTAMVLLDESHCSAHSYADLGLIALDVFTCGNTDPHDVLKYMREELDLGDVSIREMGRFDISEEMEHIQAMDHLQRELAVA